MKWQCTVCDHTERAHVRPALCNYCGAPDAFLPHEGEHMKRSAFVSATEIKATATPRQRYATRDSDLDAVLGGGVPEGARVLVHGRGGSGKSRCCLRWATRIGSTAIISLEMQEDEAVRTCDEAGGRISQLRVTRDELAPLPRVRSIVYDSISEARQPELALERLKDWASSTGGIVWLVCHATKSGDYRGPSTLQHWGEAEIKVRKAKQGHSRALVLKSRFCSTGSALVPLVGLRSV